MGKNRRVTDKAGGSRRSAVPAFTLIEVLVVLGIVAVLAGILLPVMGAARGRAQARVCASNLGQIGKAFLMYAQDYDGGIPRLTNFQFGLDESGFGTSPAPGGLQRSQTRPDYLWACLGSYLKDRRVLFCPADPFAGQAVVRWSVDHQYTSYVMSDVAPLQPWWRLDDLPLRPLPPPLYGEAKKGAVRVTSLKPSRQWFAGDAEAEAPHWPGPVGDPPHFLPMHPISDHGGAFNYVAYDGSLHTIPISKLGPPRITGIKR